MHSVFEHTAYQCRNNSECGVDCASAQVDIALKRENVVRLELGAGDEAWLMAIVFVDAIGKAHQTTAILSKPASCVFDNLELKTVAPVVDGVIQQPAPVEEVIFDLSPSS